MDWLLIYTIVSYVIMIIICRNWKDSSGAIPMDELEEYADLTMEQFKEMEQDAFIYNKMFYVICAPIILPVFICLGCLAYLMKVVEYLIK